MELTDCLCINCEEMINPGLFEIHSKVCFRVANHVKRLEEFDDATILDYKIDKLKCALEGNLHSGKLDDSLLNGHFRRLISVATELMMISGSTEDDFSLCNDKLKELGEVAHIKNFQFIVYYERLKHLGLVTATQAKAELILTRVNRKENLSLDEELNKQNEELEKLKEQLAFYKQKANKMQGLLNRRIDDVRSEVGSVSGDSILSKSRGSTVSSMSSFFEDEPGKVDTLEDELVEQKVALKEKTEEGMRRYFYSQCIVIKLSLGKNYKKNVLIAQLYQKQLCERVKSLEEEVKILPEECRSYQKEVRFSEKKVQSLEEKVEILQEEVRSYQKEARSSGKKVQSLEEEARSSKKKVKSLEEKVEILKEESRSHKKESRSYKKECRLSKKKSQSLEKEIHQLREMFLDDKKWREKNNNTLRIRDYITEATNGVVNEFSQIHYGRKNFMKWKGLSKSLSNKRSNIYSRM